MVFCGVTLFSSCSSKTSETINTPKKNVSTEIISENEPTTVNTEILINWINIRTDSVQVKELFTESGNKFSFYKDSLSSVIHAYIGYNSNSNQLIFTLVDAKADLIENNLVCLSKENLSTERIPLFTFEPTHENNADSINWVTANQRINNWNEEPKRNKWILDRFNETDSNAIFQAFVIHAVDFEYGVEHNCFLALKDTIIDGSTIYEADLIIVNSKTMKIVSSTQNLEDLTRPVPPFGSGKDKFGTIYNL
jgi:hypothetical protein